MSVQLDTYLAARARGDSVELACELSTIGHAEALLHEEDIASGALELPHVDFFDRQSGDENRHDPSTEEEVMARDDKTNDTGELAIALAADTLRGDVRDSLLAWFKAQPKAWPQLNEREQKDLALAVDHYSERMVKQTAEIIAKGERPCVVAELVEYKEKDGVEAKLKLGSTEEVVRALHEACGQEVLLVTTGLDNFTGEQAPAEDHADSDQPDLNIGAEYEPA